MSHCCVPNIKISTKDDFSYVCESTVSIKKGDEIVTSYHHYYYHLYGTMYRYCASQEGFGNYFSIDDLIFEEPGNLTAYVTGVR